ncbi:O-antigen ligase domain-containing protein [Argonema antarcticum]|uniref:O-antigen ligase domain-containing protein n=1 Tax=Argonema antarcticum TaxID=2942763 RepID=UPI002012ECE9|nr:O-antigen ligase domain-containing protein [Argonema antarcticum]MCL1474289.1 O-antigen ligase domain-containing protein [Argonema antarcticum A004/B2]
MINSLFANFIKTDKISAQGRNSLEIYPQNFEEKIIWYSITGVYVLYFIGAQHLLAPGLAWFFGFYICKKLWNQTEETPPEERITIPIGIWVWIICMIFMEVTLVVSHIDYDMDLLKTIKSTINFFVRTWALFALFPLIGCLKIRPQLIYRAICIVCLQSLIFIPICYISSLIHLKSLLYVSPLFKLGGVGAEYYNVYLYGVDGETHQARLYLFTPWAPALGLVGDIYFFLTYKEASKKWRWIGIIGAAAMVWGSASRLGLLCLLILPVVNFALGYFSRPIVQLGTGVFSFLAGLFGIQIINWAKDFKAQFDGQRAGSSRVREILANLAMYRWKTEAPIWGHGVAEPKGPPVTTGKPIGSHHTWFGLLFANGIVGLIAFAIPLTWSFIEFFIKAQKSAIAQTALGVLLVLFFYTFAENVEALIYVYWPGLVLMGIAFKEKLNLNILS